MSSFGRLAIGWQALNDDDNLIRREATEAIGKIGLQQRAMPELMDAVALSSHNSLW